MNAGGGYNSATSIFTCPVSGFYYIYFNGHVAFHAADEAAHIMKDGANMAMVSMNVSKILVTCKFEDLSLSTNNLYDFQAVWYITSGTNMESMVTESVLLECQQGSEIWLEASKHGCLLENNFDRSSIFGGFLLRQL